MQVREDVKERGSLSPFTRLAIALLVMNAVPEVLRYWLPSLIAVGIGAIAACGVSYFLAVSSQDGRNKFTVMDWIIVLLIVANALVFEYLRTVGKT